MHQLVNVILYKLQTGCQWHFLPTHELVGKKYSWKSVYHHHRKWSKMGAWENVWIKLLERNKDKLDRSSIQLDGSHTPAKRGGDSVGYQGRKKTKTTNVLFLTNNQGIPLGCSHAVGGNHNNSFELKKQAEVLIENLHQSKITEDGLFLNADAGFDTEEFREGCFIKGIHENTPANKCNSKGRENSRLFDELLYARRFVIERTNAWIDEFKSLLIRFDTSAVMWRTWHIITFTLLFLRKL